MRLTFQLLLAILFIASSGSLTGQSTCQDPAGPINQNTVPLTCYEIPDSSDTLDLCFTFTAPGSLLLFTSVPPANCDHYNVTAQLFDSACLLINPNAFGIVFVTPGQSYTWCGHYVCTGSIGYSPNFCPSYSDFSPLPVTWLYFFGKYNQLDGSVRLDWATASEENSDHFDIEQGWDGEQFKFIGKESAAGFSSTTRYYHVIDEHPGTIPYYRIRQVDRNGQSILSNTISVYSVGSAEIPTKIYDFTGRLVRADGRTDYLNPGFYFISTGDAFLKFVK